MTLLRVPIVPVVVAFGVLAGAALAGSPEVQPAPAENQSPQPAAAANAAFPSVTDAERADARAIFAGQCAWCHGSYGMTADKAPRLAGTEMTDPEVQERIRNGKPGYMPSFRRFLNDQQIALMAKYIKSLKPDD